MIISFNCLPMMVYRIIRLQFVHHYAIHRHGSLVLGFFGTSFHLNGERARIIHNISVLTQISSQFLQERKKERKMFNFFHLMIIHVRKSYLLFSVLPSRLTIHEYLIIAGMEPINGLVNVECTYYTQQSMMSQTSE